MKVLHINYHDISGGASIAAFRLHEAMRASGIDSTYLAQNRTINDREDVRTVDVIAQNIRRPMNTLLEHIAVRNMRGTRSMFSSFRFGVDISRRTEIKEADIIYLHWIVSFVSTKVLIKILKTGKPVFWVMHDMFPITGGCHHSFECDEYKRHCLHCPCCTKRGILPALSKRGFQKKAKIYSTFANLHFIAPSRWLYACAKESALLKGSRVDYVPNLIDSAVFKPFDKESAREFLSLGHTARLIGFGAAAALSNPYKGWQYLKDALDILSKDKSMSDIELVIMGSSYHKEIAGALPFPCRFLGYLRDEYTLALVYNSLDVFVVPSIAENFPNTILESLACNTPVVGFDIGGIPDTVTEHTGYLAEYKNSGDLAHGIREVLQRPRGNVMDAIRFARPAVVLKQHEELWKAL